MEERLSATLSHGLYSAGHFNPNNTTSHSGDKRTTIPYLVDQVGRQPSGFAWVMWTSRKQASPVPFGISEKEVTSWSLWCWVSHEQRPNTDSQNQDSSSVHPCAFFYIEKLLGKELDNHGKNIKITGMSWEPSTYIPDRPFPFLITLMWQTWCDSYGQKAPQKETS